ncbi:MAG: DUF1573 domain-containing protein [Bacteroidetes bacterium]|nr:DUF1573 domain-containing protein [Bacteroidota bacterium]
MKHSYGRAVLALALLLCAGASVQAQSKLEIVGGSLYDWGTVDPGKLKAKVELKNTGKAKINITEVHPTCLCTIAPIDKNVLAPGESAHIDITLDARERTGIVERSIKITWIDSSVANAHLDTTWLRLKANVYRDISVGPVNSIVVGSSKVGEEVRAVPLRIKNNSDKPITVQVPTISAGANCRMRFELAAPKAQKPGEEPSSMAFSAPKELNAGEEYQLKAFVTPTVEGNLTGQISIKTSSPKSPEILLGVSGRVAGAGKPAAAASTPAPNGAAPRK